NTPRHRGQAFVHIRSRPGSSPGSMNIHSPNTGRNGPQQGSAVPVLTIFLPPMLLVVGGATKSRIWPPPRINPVGEPPGGRGSDGSQGKTPGPLNSPQNPRPRHEIFIPRHAF